LMQPLATLHHLDAGGLMTPLAILALFWNIVIDLAHIHDSADMTPSHCKQRTVPFTWSYTK